MQKLLHDKKQLRIFAEKITLCKNFLFFYLTFYIDLRLYYR